ncbi:MAG: DUF4255 domain-containing protein [Methanocella sp.]
MSSDNIGGVTQTLAKLISDGIKADVELQKLLHTEELVTLQAPSNQAPSGQISLLLYSVTECASMRNMPEQPGEPRTLMYLSLRYLITPQSKTPQMDQLLLGKVMQILAERPIIPVSALQGSLSQSGSEGIKIVFDAMSLDDLNKVWTMLSVPYKPSISYSVYPVPIKSETQQTAPVLPPATTKPPIAVLPREKLSA